MVLAGHAVRLPGPAHALAAALGRRARASRPGVAVVPHYDAWPEPLSALIALQAPRGSVVLGIDEETAVVGRDGAWQVHGRSRVTVWRGRRRERFRAGEVFRI